MHAYIRTDVHAYIYRCIYHFVRSNREGYFAWMNFSMTARAPGAAATMNTKSKKNCSNHKHKKGYAKRNKRQTEPLLFNIMSYLCSHHQIRIQTTCWCLHARDMLPILLGATLAGATRQLHLSSLNSCLHSLTVSTFGVGSGATRQPQFEVPAMYIGLWVSCVWPLTHEPLWVRKVGKI